MDIQISDKNFVNREQLLSDKFQIMKSKIDLKEPELHVSNKQRFIDKLLQ